MAGVYTDQRLNLSKLGKAFGRKPRFQTGPGKSGRPGLYGGFGKRKPWWDCEPVLQSKEQERKPLTYSGARPISIPVDLSSRQTQYVVKDLEIGKPINSNKCSEAADGVTREGVKSCPRAGCGKSACPVVCPAKAGMFSRRQTCRGRSQSPVVWIAEVMETETLKPIDEVSPGEATSHRAVTKVNALWPRK